MKRVLTLLAIVLSVFMLFGCAKRETIGCTYLEGDACDKEKIVLEEEVAVVDDTAKETAEEVTEAVEEVVEVVEVLPEEVKEAVQEAVWTKYMIQPGDYLMKIALEEYGVVTMWREIWDWNKELVGDNPDLIYPYDELNLLKDGNVEEKEVEVYDYTVKEGETLWCIAKKLYGNNYAWVVLLRDNMEVVGEDYDSLSAGTVLKVRKDL